MIGRSLVMAVACGLAASSAVTVPVETAPQSPARERGQSHTDTQDINALRHAAERGDADAQYALADAYSNFRVESMEDAEALAVRWYKLAANQGHAEAQLQLGLRHEQGWGVPEDSSEAVRWYRLAANQESARAQFNLGVMYRDGQGVTQDPVEAHMWLNLAATHSFDGQDQYAHARDQLAEEMTSAQIAEARRLGREWKPAPPE